ncbi:MAG: RluA family pseudouridine synthase [Candidatus Pacebacteria bacterium]|jgi:23S rRNA pseudouridine1911/1915/1917 synthase|nr:RNA pseudouridine synthase [Parcubacteria group bacterium]MDP7159424.1 RluA family pseudouridine synthase [Candidatus Paceibacterota bacterium]MDP7366546.1 RluA family pseudouridine synthase [Candidatus Paceibacterota bacterium]MDP7466408.1 RluA family pseudouridine synthase [Candidatus Paceibacterota bacterium]MDP7648402.1 RluA family pseudouridine synthase [Candidatus Paceibacterota bacterium]|tara:strand:+ start:395 stop:1108 length:714 start_codon:yes stop_codon:yes gene_type:complete
MDIKIIFENEEVVILNKPIGLVVHSDGKTDEPTLVDFILENYPEVEGVGEPAVYDGKEIARPGIVHRLDRETSGVIVIAKTQDSFLNLKKQFQERKITKTYNAFLYGTLKDKSGVIDLPIGRSKSDFKQWSAQHGARGELREALTQYKVLKENKDFAYVEVIPKTGRTHQIRVHFKAIDNQVVCDKIYAPKRECGLGFKRLALHARTLSFKLQNGEIITAEAELPQDFEKALEIIAN